MSIASQCGECSGKWRQRGCCCLHSIIDIQNDKHEFHYIYGNECNQINGSHENVFSPTEWTHSNQSFRRFIFFENNHFSRFAHDNTLHTNDLEYHTATTNYKLNSAELIRNYIGIFGLIILNSAGQAPSRPITYNEWKYFIQTFVASSSLGLFITNIDHIWAMIMSGYKNMSTNHDTLTMTSAYE